MKTTLTLALILAMIAAATAYSADLLVDDFSAGSTPPDEGRIYETLLDAGWRATSAYSLPCCLGMGYHWRQTGESYREYDQLRRV